MTDVALEVLHPSDTDSSTGPTTQRDWPGHPHWKPQEDPWQPIVLSLDGGGIRGLSSLFILKRLMEKVRDEERKHNRDRSAPRPPSQSPNTVRRDGGQSATGEEHGSLPLPCHYFDFIVGTSTGGLIAVMLGRLRLDVNVCINEYKSLGTLVFGNWRWWRLTKYDYRTLECAIKYVVETHCKEHGGPDKCNGDDLLKQYDFSHIEGRYKNRTCKVALVAIREGERDEADRPYLFRSYDHPEAPPTHYNQFDNVELNPGRVQRDTTKIWEACRATSAAPLYFNKITIVGVRYMDGGVGEGANNPSAYALNEALQMADRQNKATEIAALISVGTGQKKAQSRFGGLFGLMTWARKVITDTQRAHEEVQTRLNDRKTPYFRFDVKPPNNSTDPYLTKMCLDECKKMKRRVDEKGKAPVRAIGATNGAEQGITNGAADRIPNLGAPVLGTQAPNQGRRKGSYKPDKYRYKTYEKIEYYTDQYCARNQSTINVENVNAKLERAAEILVWYRRRREEQDPEAWRHFRQHPYPGKPDP